MESKRRLCRRDDGDDDDDDRSLVLPEDIFIKVLSWLPVKSLLRFRCLSKRWLDFIASDPYFIHLHSRQSKFKPSLFFSNETRKVENNGTSYLQSSMDMEGNLLGKFEISSWWKGSYSPLVLPTRFDLVCFQTGNLFHVCNPSTHELITLEALFDCNYDTFGFGYVESTDEYKIVILNSEEYYDDFHSPTECSVFTLGMAEDSPSSYASPWSWRHIGNTPYPVECNQWPAFVNGALHWIDIEQTILAFNVESEEFTRLDPGRIGCPDHLTKWRLQLVELRGLLYLSCAIAGDKIEIWMLKGYHHNEKENHDLMWVKEYNIDLSTLDDPYRSFRGLYFPRDIQDDGKKVLIGRLEGGSFYYHLQTATFSGFLWEIKRRSHFSFYTESLRSLRHVLRRRFNFDQITEGTQFHSQCLAELNPPIYIVRVYADYRPPGETTYGGYITKLTGHFVAIEGKTLEAEDSNEAEVKAILYGLQFAREQGIQCIGLVSSARKIVDAIITRERQNFQRLEKILTLIIDLLSEFSWAEIFHDRRMSTRIAYQLACHAYINEDFCYNEPPEWFIDG